MNKISISIPGSNGKMGKTLLNLILESSKYEIASATCLPNENEVGFDIGLFAGKSKIEQHKMVYNSLKGRMGNELHALAIKTKES